MILEVLAKLHLKSQGFLPDRPYHHISRDELLEAFLNDSGDDYFHTMYPLPDPSLEEEYNALVAEMKKHIEKFSSSASRCCCNSYIASSSSSSSDRLDLPKWIYSYMLGTVVGPYSSTLDKHDLFVRLGTDNIDDEWTPICSQRCYEASKQWISKYISSKPTEYRPPALYGEPHVIKYLCLKEEEIVGG